MIKAHSRLKRLNPHNLQAPFTIKDACSSWTTLTFDLHNNSEHVLHVDRVLSNFYFGTSFCTQHIIQVHKTLPPDTKTRCRYDHMVYRYPTDVTFIGMGCMAIEDRRYLSLVDRRIPFNTPFPVHLRTASDREAPYAIPCISAEMNAHQEIMFRPYISSDEPLHNSPLQIICDEFTKTRYVASTILTLRPASENSDGRIYQSDLRRHRDSGLVDQIVLSSLYTPHGVFPLNAIICRNDINPSRITYRRGQRVKMALR